VTGASGYIAAHCVQTLLAHGFRVRGTVRSESKGNYLKNLFDKEFGPSKFEYVIVEDLQKPSGFNPAFEKHDVDAVLHVASPYHFNFTSVQKDLIDPALNGTLSLLNAAKDENAKGGKVKRVVLTSSFAAIINPKAPPSPPYVYTENDWNTGTIEIYKEKGDQVDGVNAYRISKIHAEKAGWDFISSFTHSDEKIQKFDLVTINPPMVYGPIIHQCDKAEDLNTSVKGIYELFKNSDSSADTLLPKGSCVDVRDVALAHTRALEVEEAGGLRFAVSQGAFNHQDMFDAIHSASLPAKYKEKVSKIWKGSKPGGGKEANAQSSYLSSQRATEILGIKFRKLDEGTVSDMMVSVWDRFD